MNEALRELQTTSRALERIDGLIRSFKVENMVAFNGRLCFRSNRITSRAELDGQLTNLIQQRDPVWQRHQTAMKEFARAKGAACD